MKQQKTATLADLKKITEIILADELNYTAVMDACKHLLEFFFHITDFDETADVNNKHLQSIAGQAVSPLAAAVCIRDFMRTRAFMRGLQKAIAARLRASAEKPVTVLYAGTGPFATLLLPLVTVFNTTQLQLLLLDINPASIAYLKSIIRYFNLEPYVIELVQADAVTYKIPAYIQPDIILSETMMPALKTEPQVSIVVNLVAQCPQALLVPQQIEITAALLNSKILETDRFISLKKIFDLTKEEALKMAAQQQNGGLVFPVSTLQIEKPVATDLYGLVMLTNIQVFEEERLDFNNSSLTLPEKAYNLQTIKRWPALFNFQYRIFPKPGFTITLQADIDIAAV